MDTYRGTLMCWALMWGTSTWASAAAAEPVDTGQGATWAVHAERLIDVRDGSVQRDVVVAVRDGRIHALYAAGKVPADLAVRELGAVTLLPGLIDAHTHLTGDPKIGTWETLGRSEANDAITGVANALATVRAGFTTVRELGAYNHSSSALRDAIDRGEVPGPRIRSAGIWIGMRGGHCDTNLLAPQYAHYDAGIADGPWAVRAMVREMAKYGADLVKFCASGGVTTVGNEPGTQQYTAEEMDALVDEAHRLGMKVAAHAHGAEAIKTAIRAGVDSVEHASLIDEEGLRLAKQRGTWLVMDVYNGDYIEEVGSKEGWLAEILRKNRETTDVQREGFRRAVRLGVPLAFGTDAGIYPHGDNAIQFGYMVRFGMTPVQAIRSATLDAARLLGVDAETGSIEVGKAADLIAVAGDPLQDIALLRHPRLVVARGRIVRDELRTPSLPSPYGAPAQ